MKQSSGSWMGCGSILLPKFTNSDDFSLQGLLRFLCVVTFASSPTLFSFFYCIRCGFLFAHCIVVFFLHTATVFVL